MRRIKGKLKLKHCKDSGDLSNGRKHTEVSSPNIGEGRGHDLEGDPSLNEGEVNATRSSSYLTAVAHDDVEEDHVLLAVRSSSKC